MKLIIPIIFTIVAMVIMAAALHFSKYKKRGSGCCGGGTVSADYTGKTCDENNTKMCICEPGKE